MPKPEDNATRSDRDNVEVINLNALNVGRNTATTPNKANTI